MMDHLETLSGERMMVCDGNVCGGFVPTLVGVLYPVEVTSVAGYGSTEYTGRIISSDWWDK